MARVERNNLKERPERERRKDFNEVCLGFSAEAAATEAARCLNCRHAPCKEGCPVGVPIPEFLAELKKGDAAAAIRVINTVNNLASVCGRVCPQEEQCEKVCVRAKMEGPVNIGALERYAGDCALKATDSGGTIAKENAEARAAAPAKAAGKKAAVIGSGPAGLSCAADLARSGVQVTLYEAFHKAGGVLVYGIPEFRLPKDLVEREINSLLRLGVKLKLNVIAGKTFTVESLLKEYDAVFLGTGAGLPQFLNVAGENLCGIYSANEYLTRINLMKAMEEGSDTPVLYGKNVVVFGAGNVAMDAARTALRMKAESVSIIYRRSEAEMPARKEEIRHAKEEGVRLLTLMRPLEFKGEGGWVKSVLCLKTELKENAGGRRVPEDILGSETEIPCDQAIIAIGTSPNPLVTASCPELKTTAKGTIIVNDRGETSVSRVYAGGDAVTGAATVILAMGAGKRAAKSILEDFERLAPRMTNDK